MFKKRLIYLLNHNYSLYLLIFIELVFLSLFALSKWMYTTPADLWRPVKLINTAEELEIPKNFNVRSSRDSLLIWDFNQWETVPLKEIDKRFSEDDPRGQDSFEVYRNIFRTEEGEHLFFVKQELNSLSFYHRLQKHNLRPLDPLISKERYRFFFLLLFFPLMFFLKAINPWEKISAVLLWLPLSLWGHPFSALILLWAFSSSFIKDEKKSTVKIIYWVISALLFLAFAVWGKSIWILLLCVSHLLIVTLSPGANVFRDHRLLEPILLLQKRKFVPRSSISHRDKVLVSMFVSFLFIISLVSSHFHVQSTYQNIERAVDYIPDEKEIIHHLSFQKSLGYLKKEEWGNHRGESIQIIQAGDSYKEGISETEVLPSTAEKIYWQQSIPEDSIEFWALQLIASKKPLPGNKIPWPLLFILSVLSWLTILIGLWQSSIDFDSQSYFVFKIKRRLKVA